jgi:enamine deaminase RidA (YjgF/YER057c/UK114 family)
MVAYENPFPSDPDRRQIWEMLVERDTRAFAAGDWGQVAGDFVAESFIALDARARSQPDSWRLSFATLDDYRASWLEESARLREAAIDLEASLYDATTLRDIEVKAEAALARKKFDGTVHCKGGGTFGLHWQSLYLCRRQARGWKVAGFVGYLPHPFPVAVGPLGAADGPLAAAIVKQLPPSVESPAPTGPYSPVLSVRAGRLVVISGQVAAVPAGERRGASMEEETRRVLENCAKQLGAAGASLTDVFKVNAYLADMGAWETFNAVYREVMPPPLPVRTTIGAKLPGDYLVEVEMWAALPGA